MSAEFHVYIKPLTLTLQLVSTNPSKARGKDTGAGFDTFRKHAKSETGKFCNSSPQGKRNTGKKKTHKDIQA